MKLKIKILRNDGNEGMSTIPGFSQIKFEIRDHTVASSSPAAAPATPNPTSCNIDRPYCHYCCILCFSFVSRCISPALVATLLPLQSFPIGCHYCCPSYNLRLSSPSPVPYPTLTATTTLAAITSCSYCLSLLAVIVLPRPRTATACRASLLPYFLFLNSIIDPRPQPMLLWSSHVAALTIVAPTAPCFLLCRCCCSNRTLLPPLPL
ncbi:hypothetical protein BHM03_00017926 [Ensete ventricosum]|nr:hypothetical protein BHM03_00017926 [Ensete ventricosum]